METSAVLRYNMNKITCYLDHARVTKLSASSGFNSVVLNFTWVFFGFLWIIFTQVLENNIGVILIFLKIRWDIRKSRCTTGIGSKFATGVNDTLKWTWREKFTIC